jgi:hypothetical protein
MESSFLIGKLLPLVEPTCNCRLELRARSFFVADLASGAIGCAALLHAETEVSKEEAAAMEREAPLASSRVVVFHLSDEHERFSTRGYALARVVLRNYASPLSDRAANVAYLQEFTNATGGVGGGDSEHVYWLPLGYSEAFIEMPALQHPTRARALAWSWSGSTLGKPRRREFLEGLQRYERTDLLRSGRLHVFKDFYDAAAVLRPSVYSAWLYQSRVAPCPDGGSAEQFRVYEALTAGAVPIVSADHPHLSYLDTLGFRALRVKSWMADAPELLDAATNNEGFVKALQDMQASNNMVLKRVMQSAQRFLAATICDAALGSPRK